MSNSVEPVTRIGFEELTTLYAVMPQRQGWRRAAQRSAGRLGAGARAFGGSGWTPIDTKGVEIGAGWLRIGQMSGKEYVSLSISALELGSKTLYANLGRAAGESDPNVYALIWNPRE